MGIRELMAKLSRIDGDDKSVVGRDDSLFAKTHAAAVSMPHYFCLEPASNCRPLCQRAAHASPNIRTSRLTSPFKSKSRLEAETRHSDIN
jgi:hypothetical protein